MNYFRKVCVTNFFLNAASRWKLKFYTLLELQIESRTHKRNLIKILREHTIDNLYFEACSAKLLNKKYILIDK